MRLFTGATAHSRAVDTGMTRSNHYEFDMDTTDSTSDPKEPTENNVSTTVEPQNDSEKGIFAY